MLSKEELQRYSRHLTLAEIRQEGQEKLKKAKVLVVGAGGLGCPLLQYLTAAGVGKIGIIDFDTVDLSNLQRQILFSTEDIGKPKAEIAKGKLVAMNPNVQIETYTIFISKENVLQILENYDMIVDCTDNFPTRYLLNDACVLLTKPYIFGAIYRFEGQVSVFNLQNDKGEKGATYRCLFPNLPKQEEIPNCAEAGVLGVLPGIIGTLQANEVLKIILGIGEPLRNRLLMLDALTLQNNLISFKRIEERADIQELGEYEEVCETSPTNLVREITVWELKQKLDKKENLQLIDVREEYEYEICHLAVVDLMPMNLIDKYLDKIATDKPVIFYCHHGKRSASVIQHLIKNYPFKNLYNLQGGIDAWAKEIEKEMAVY